MLKSLKVRDYMNTHPITCSPQMDLFKAVDMLLANRVSGAPVIDAEGHLVGRRDLLLALKSFNDHGVPKKS